MESYRFEFKLWSHCLLALWSWLRDVISLSLSLFVEWTNKTCFGSYIKKHNWLAHSELFVIEIVIVIMSSLTLFSA